jgi:hypothetical protein
LHHEAAAVRQWLIGRIDSLQRGKRAIFQERQAEQDTSSLQAASLGELIKHFENVSASFNSSGLTGAINSRRSGMGYREFKS